MSCSRHWWNLIWAIKRLFCMRRMYGREVPQQSKTDFSKKIPGLCRAQNRGFSVRLFFGNPFPKKWCAPGNAAPRILSVHSLHCVPETVSGNFAGQSLQPEWGNPAANVFADRKIQRIFALLCPMTLSILPYHNKKRRTQMPGRDINCGSGLWKQAQFRKCTCHILHFMQNIVCIRQMLLFGISTSFAG